MNAVSRAVLLFVSLLLLAASPGCGSLEHVRALRQAQDDFSALAAKENRLALAHLLPEQSALSQPSYDWKAAWKDELVTGFGPSDIYENYAKYREIYLRIQAVNRRARPRLKQDNLYGSAFVMEVMAFWRTTFFAHLLGINSAADAVRDRAGGQATNTIQAAVPSNAMTEVVARANRALAVVKKEGTVLYPRDQFLLESTTPLVRYDIAYLNALRADRAGQLDADNTPLAEVRKRVASLVEQMAQAEEDLQQSSARQPEHIRYYAALARLSMLRTAVTLGDRARVSFLTDEAKELFPRLARRLDAFASEARTNNSDAARLLAQLNRKPEDLLRRIGRPE